MKLQWYAVLLFLPGFILFTAVSPLAADEEEWAADGNIEVGYRAISTDGAPDRAAEYYSLESSPILDFDLQGGDKNRRYIFEGIYLNEKEYLSEAHLNYGGMVRLDLRTERFFHNLDHIPYDPSTPKARQNAFADPDSIPNSGNEELRVIFSDQDPGDNYGIRLDINEASFRAKAKTFPAHLNLNYWRFERKGDRQLRFVDEGFDHPDNSESCNVCHMQSRSRGIDRVTDEVSANVNAHLGPIDVIVEQLYREFRDREPIPIDTFQGHTLRPEGRYQHDEDPDVTLSETTLKVHTSLSGGVVGAASFTIGERENRSDLAGGQPFGLDGVSAETDYYKAAGDLTYIPSPRWTFNFRYRLLDLDSDNSSRVSAYSEEYLVRQSVDLRRSSHEAMIAFRPFHRFTLKGEYQIENLHRGNTGGPEAHHGDSAPIGSDPMHIDEVWELPEDEVLQRFKVGILARPLGTRKLKLNIWYQYRTSDDPAYAASFENRHELFFGSTYMPSAFWGINLTAKALVEENDRQKRFLLDGNDDPKRVELDREREQQDIGLGIWVNPASRLSAGINYGFMRTRIRQNLLFGNDPGNPTALPDPIASHFIEDELVEYAQRVHTLSANASYGLTEELTLRIDGYHIRSFAEFSPGFFIDSPSLDFPADSTGLKELSRIDIRQNGLSAGLDWTPASTWRFSLRYTFNDYEDRNKDVFDGKAQTYMASVSRSW